MRAKYRMGLSFSKWLVVSEVFKLDQGHVVSLAEALELSPEVKDRISYVKGNYLPSSHQQQPHDHLIAAILGFKPAAIIRYDHHPENPASALVVDAIKKDFGGNNGRIQAELLSHGLKVRPDFHILHMNLPKYSIANIFVGGRAAVEELWQIYKCQYFLDYASSDDHKNLTPEIMNRINSMANSRCEVFCKRGEGGINCAPIHKRIGELLGYPEHQVDDFIKGLMSQKGYNHMPDLEYPFELPPSLAAVPRKKGFEPHESRQHFVRSKAPSFI